jgi:hypothetical protein
VTGFLRSFWGSLVMLIALMIVLERAAGVSRILGASGSFVGTTVKAFR